MKTREKMKVCVLTLGILTGVLLSGCASQKETKEAQKIAEEETTADALMKVQEEETTADALTKVQEEETTADALATAQEEETTAEALTEAQAEEARTEKEGTAEAREKAQAANEKANKTEEPAAFTVTPWETAKTMYATIAINVRKGPGTAYDVIGHLAAAQEVTIVGQADTGWYQLLCNGEEAYVSNRYLSEEQPAAQPTAAEAANATAQQPNTAAAPAGVIMVGDSRCVQMQSAVGGGSCSWVCENSKEYTWFVNTAIPKFDEYVGKGSKVVINLGVNDPEHYAQYAETINAKAAEWAQRGAKTYLVSVNPVWENPYTTQEQVDTFNANIPGMLVGVTWIDTSSWLTNNGYRLLDGLHYDDATYVNIYNLIMGSL